MDLPAPKRKYLEQAFTTPNHNGNLYNTENDSPVDDKQMVNEGDTQDTMYTEPGSNRKVVDTKRIQRTKVGDTVIHNGDETKVVGKNGFMLKLYNENNDVIITVPVGETAFRDDILSNSNIEQQVWDRTSMEQRHSMLGKARVDQKDFASRDWFDLPDTLRTVLKEQASNGAYTEPAGGGFAGREPGMTRPDESKSWRDQFNNPHVFRSLDQPQADALKTDIKVNPEGIIGEDEDGKVHKEDRQNRAAIVGDNDREGHKGDTEETKSNIEHNALGGVVTDIPFEASSDYEETITDDKLSGAQEEIATVGNSPARHPKDPKDNTEEVRVGYMPKKGEQHEGGTHPNLQYHCDICQQKHKTADHEELEKEGLTSNSVGVTNPVHGDEKKKNKGTSRELQVKNKYNSRWGLRYNVTQEEFDEQRINESHGLFQQHK